MTEIEAAGKVIDKILGLANPPRLIAVFVGKEKNTIQMTLPSSGVFRKAFEVRKSDFCGVYDEAVTVEMLVDDLRYAGFTQ